MQTRKRKTLNNNFWLHFTALCRFNGFLSKALICNAFSTLIINLYSFKNNFNIADRLPENSRR